MRAAIFHGPKQPLTVEEVDIDKPNGREVLVKSVACGVCHSDLHFADGVWPMMPPAILGHEPTGVGSVINAAEVEAGSPVAIFGCGGIGLAAVQGARIAGALQIIAVDMFESKLAMAKRLGATDTIDASAGDPVGAVMGLAGRGVDYSFEWIELKEVAEHAIAVLKPGDTATALGVIPLTRDVEMD